MIQSQLTLGLAWRWLASATIAAVGTFTSAQVAFSQVAPPSDAVAPNEQSLLRPAQSPDEPLPLPPNAATAPQQANQDFQVLEEGPVHEAFAEPLTPNPSQGVVVTQQPPEPVNETPPEYRPEGENVEWIPGYWTWLADRDNFVWVSGVWRSIPPGRAWTPGHWAQMDNGFVWVNGFWTEVTTQEVNYLPLPPDSLEQGPSSAAPADNYFWIPGCWVWQQNAYNWRPGYWYPGHTRWLWVPDHYVYTPRGAVFVRGYWDYPLVNRGLLYAPVYWQNGYRGRTYAYTPNRVVNTALLLTSLFVDNNRGYYYYGRGYGGRNNYYPWYANRSSAYYSPFFGYYSWQYGRNSNDWRNRFDYDRYQKGYNNLNVNNRMGLVGTVDQLARAIDDDYRRGDRDRDYDRNRSQFRQLTDNERNEARDRSKQMDQFRDARKQFESKKGELAQTDLRREGDRDSSRRVPENYKPAKFNMQSNAAAEQLMRNAREQYQRYEQRTMRPNLDQNRNSQPRSSDLKSSQNSNSNRSQSTRPSLRQPMATPPTLSKPQRVERSKPETTNRSSSPNIKVNRESSNRGSSPSINVNRGNSDRGSSNRSSTPSVNRTPPSRGEARSNSGGSNRGSSSANRGSSKGSSDKGSSNKGSGGKGKGKG